MNIQWDTKLADLDLDTQIIQILSDNGIEYWEKLTCESIGDYQRMGLSPDQISEIISIIKNNS